ncbi:MAG: response regulator [Bryobacteraceae bacterium]
MEEESRLTCPNCGWKHVRPSPRRGLFDGVMRGFYLAPFRCRKCRLRFYRPAHFWISSPSETVKIPAVSAVSEPAAATSVLLLDDDPSLRTLFRRLLERDGYKVYEASNRAEISGKMSKASLGLVIANLNSTDGDNLSTARTLQATNPDLKVIVLSNVVGTSVFPTEAVPGKLAVLETPLHPRDLLETVHELLGSGVGAGRH